MGQSKEEKNFHKQMAKQAQENTKLQREMFELNKAGTPEQQGFRKEKAEFDAWLAKKDFGSSPPNGILNFDLYTPSRVADMRSRLADVTGIGAASLGGTGDQSIALQQSRDRNVNQMAMDQANAYENAVKQQDAFYKGNTFQWGQLAQQNSQNLLGNASSMTQFFTEQQKQTLPKSFWATFGPALMGGALSAGGALLGNPNLFRA
jgi:hypothetical protein